ncbi:MAG: cupin domain-containing protein, partial [candidate division Zixibacteria bacterium]|nr:cupin domain-containing protein [candidate division Zixibacteria bacterium]
MLIRKLSHCPEILAGDRTRLRELLHPDRDYEFSGRYSLAHAVVAPGESSTPHRLKTSEAYYILAGHGEMHVDSESACVEAGDALEIKPGSTQWIRNTSTDD